MIFEQSDRTAVAAAGLTIGTRRTDDERYVGVLRRGRTIVVECGHSHHNRDTSTRTSGTSASDCMRELVQASSRPKLVEYNAEQIATAWMRLGPWVLPSTRDIVRHDAPVAVAFYRGKVAAVVAALTP